MKLEEKARQRIDKLLDAAGWSVQSMSRLNLSASLGVAVREFPVESGFADYVLFVDRQAVGVIEAKSEGMTLSGVAGQSAAYMTSFPSHIPHVRLPLPFAYESTEIETFFRDERDPNPRSRRLLAFHRPETLREWLAQENMLTWLHLSDLHFRTTELHAWDEDIVLQALLEDVRECMDEYKLAPDLILVSGDIAFSGAPAEYDLAQAFFDKLLAMTGLSKERMFVVPGNHDVNRDKISQGALAHVSSLDNRHAVDKALIDYLDCQVLLCKFDDYGHFVNSYFGSHTPFDYDHYFYVQSLELAGHRVEVLGLNSAWLAYGGHDERGHLALGERQIRQALDTCGNAELRIALLHHPFDWLSDFDEESCKARLMDSCGFILSGHLHRPGLEQVQTPDARVMIIAAGACYEAREHQNSYNLVRLDLEARQGTVFLRAWSDRKGGFWTADVQAYRSAIDGRFAFPLDDYLTSLYVPRARRDLVEGILTVDSLETIETQFSRHTDRALDRIRPLVPGIGESPLREQVIQLEDKLQQGKPVALTGDAGTGKSGVGAKLALAAREEGIVVLLLDARRLGHIQDENQLRRYFDLNSPVHSAIERIGRRKRCRFIIDQLDNIAGLDSATLLVDLAIECCQFEGVEVTVISRKRATHEKELLKRLTDAGFIELTSHPLSEDTAAEELSQLGISQPSPHLISLGRNLLNLELIGTIKQKRSDFDSSVLMDEVDLWEQYIQILLERESSRESAEQIINEAVRLAREGLNNEDRTFCLDHPFSRRQNRLISWGIIVCEERVCRFRHEKFQDFLCAWDATQRHAMPATVLNEIGAYRTRNVLLWMRKIYSRRSPQLYKQFWKEAFHV